MSEIHKSTNRLEQGIAIAFDIVSTKLPHLGAAEQEGDQATHSTMFLCQDGVLKQVGPQMACQVEFLTNQYQLVLRANIRSVARCIRGIAAHSTPQCSICSTDQWW